MFLSPLEIVVDAPVNQGMIETFTKIIAELLLVFALATKQVKEGSLS
jgi:hypothetical protein